MKTTVTFGALVLLSCGTNGTYIRSNEQIDEKLVHVETRAGSFVVRENAAIDFQRLLAGQTTEHIYYADRKDRAPQR